MKHSCGGKGGGAAPGSKKTSLGGSMGLGGFGGKPKAGSSISPGAKVTGAATTTGDAGREHDPNEGKKRQNPGNP